MKEGLYRPGTGLLYLPLNRDVKMDRLSAVASGWSHFGGPVWKCLFGPADEMPDATPQGEEVGRALHGTGAEGGPRSASTVWIVVA